MSEKYKTTEKEKGYFVTFTIVEWLNVFQDDAYKMILVDAIKFYQQKQRLIVFAYCIMPSHVHMIAQSNGEERLSDVLRDLKKFTSKEFAKKLEEASDNASKLALKIFIIAGKRLKRISKYKVWQDGNHPMMLFNNKIIWQKLNYIHNNPVKAGIVLKAEDYMFSSARNYAELSSFIDVELLSREMITI